MSATQKNNEWKGVYTDKQNVAWDWTCSEPVESKTTIETISNPGEVDWFPWYIVVMMSSWIFWIFGYFLYIPLGAISILWIFISSLLSGSSRVPVNLLVQSIILVLGAIAMPFWGFNVPVMYALAFWSVLDFENYDFDLTMEAFGL